MQQYKHFISLGYFCSIALELEKMGLRETSSPFDWCISDYEGIINAIENRFEDYLEYDFLLQCSDVREHYFNEKYKIWFFHDFDKYHSLKKQIAKVKKKYFRRIDRFYENIKQPTLFIRYISDEILNESNRSKELEWIEKNNCRIVTLLKSFNEDNEVLYIANNGVTSDIIKIYNVEKDENDVVARRPLDCNIALKELFENFDYEQRQKNIEVFIRKKKRKNSYFFKFYKKLSLKLKGIIFDEYIHDKIFLSNWYGKDIV